MNQKIIFEVRSVSLTAVLYPIGTKTKPIVILPQQGILGLRIHFVYPVNDTIDIYLNGAVIQSYGPNVGMTSGFILPFGSHDYKDPIEATLQFAYNPNRLPSGTATLVNIITERIVKY